MAESAARCGAELYAEALRLRQEARDQYDFPSEGYALCVAEAQLCATLALAAATALCAVTPETPMDEFGAWRQAAGVAVARPRGGGERS